MPRIDETRPFLAVQIGVMTVSDTRTIADDKSGQTLVDLITRDGHVVADRITVKDDATAIALVESGAKTREHRLRRGIGEERGPAGIGGRKTEVDHDDVTGIVARHHGTDEEIPRALHARRRREVGRERGPPRRARRRAAAVRHVLSTAWLALPAVVAVRLGSSVGSVIGRISHRSGHRIWALALAQLNF